MFHVRRTDQENEQFGYHPYNYIQIADRAELERLACTTHPELTKYLPRG